MNIKTRAGGNSHIHYRYAIGFLLFLLIALVAGAFYDVPDLVKRLSFALTLSSLLLALVAIFFTVISNQKQEHQISKINETNMAISESAEEIRRTASELRHTVSDLPKNFSHLGEKIDNLRTYSTLSYMPAPVSDDQSADKHDERKEHEKSVDEEDQRSLGMQDVQDKIMELQFGSMIVIYMFVVGSYRATSIPLQYFDEYTMSSSDYAMGTLSGFRATGLINFVVHEGAIIPKQCDDGLKKNIRLILDQIIKALTERDIDGAEDLQTHIDKIDKLYKVKS